MYRVEGTTGVVDAPATLLAMEGDTIDVRVPALQVVRVRMHAGQRWSVEPAPTCLDTDDHGWLRFGAPRAGDYRLRIGLIARDAVPCPRAAS